MSEKQAPMAFTVAAKAGLFRQILTPVTVFEPFDPGKPPTSPPRQHDTLALWDTGSSGTVLTPAVVNALGLTPTGSRNVSTAGGSRRSNSYVVNLWLPNQVGLTFVPATECVDNAPTFGVIVGMDIITQGDFSVTNQGGRSMVSFRMPPHRHIDYVTDSDIREARLGGRNAPCRCGSGKKTKRCCGA